MRWSVVAGVAFAVGMSSSALADGPFRWTGFFVGINGGYSWGNADTELAASSTTRTRLFRDFGGANTLVSDTGPVAGPGGAISDSTDVNGWLGGGQIGYNWQVNQWVLGIEADIQGTGQDGSLSFCSDPACGAGSSFLNERYKLDWFGTVRGRVGFLVDPRLLLYATGGLAYGHFEAEHEAGIVGGPSASFSDDKTKAGWVIGGGGEWALAKNWLLRAEYLYMDLGEVASAGGSATSTTIIPPGGAGGHPQFTTVRDTAVNASMKTDFTDHIFRVGLSYKFGEDRDYVPLK